MTPTPPFNFSFSYFRLFLSWIFFFVGAGLLISTVTYVQDEQKKTLWVLDNSLSMIVQDITDKDGYLISRLDSAKSLIGGAHDKISGEHAFLIFDSSAHLLLPFSGDDTTFVSIVDAVEPVLYGGGTDIANVLQSISWIYPHESMDIVLLTDGEISRTGGVLPELPYGAHLTLVGVGTESGGPMLQGYNALGKPRYKQYNGQDAISRLDTSTLEKVAKNYHASLFFLDSQAAQSSIVEALYEESYTVSVFGFRDTMALLGVVLILLAAILPPYRMMKMRKSAKT